VLLNALPCNAGMTGEERATELGSHRTLALRDCQVKGAGALETLARVGLEPGAAQLATCPAS
jgi:hypothetical protein